jgi:hypothetical protein
MHTVFCASLLAYEQSVLMPKNPNKRRINPGMITHVTLVNKDTAKDRQHRLVRLGAEETPKSKTANLESSPTKPHISSTCHDLLHHMGPNFDEDFMDFEEVKPRGLCAKKVVC